jgi:hypothetical protein
LEKSKRDNEKRIAKEARELERKRAKEAKEAEKKAAKEAKDLEKQKRVSRLGYCKEQVRCYGVLRFRL